MELTPSKLRTYYATKDSTDKVNRQAKDWNMMFATLRRKTKTRDLISNICQELWKNNNKDRKCN